MFPCLPGGFPIALKDLQPFSSKVKTMLEEHQASMPVQQAPFYPSLRHGKREFCTISVYVYVLYKCEYNI